ncbi:MAG TPA: hypothetical protein VIT92_07645, partial [Burkholderiaceae bacterium]
MKILLSLFAITLLAGCANVRNAVSKISVPNISMPNIQLFSPNTPVVSTGPNSYSATVTGSGLAGAKENAHKLANSTCAKQQMAAQVNVDAILV